MYAFIFLAFFFSSFGYVAGNSALIHILESRKHFIMAILELLSIKDVSLWLETTLYKILFYQSYIPRAPLQCMLFSLCTFYIFENEIYSKYKILFSFHLHPCCRTINTCADVSINCRKINTCWWRKCLMETLISHFQLKADQRARESTSRGQ